ncbi:MAG: lanthionine synthetase C family protein [Pseudonocardiaceae bacterium]
MPPVPDELAYPPVDDPAPWWGQSLANGALGPALLHIVHARTGGADWTTAHAWVRAVTRKPISANLAAGLFHGVPALAYVLHTAEFPGYARALEVLDRHVDTLVRRRIDEAHSRIDQGRLARLVEYDLIKGLTGLGAHLLAHRPHSIALAEILTYLVRLTEPIHVDGETFPGWWSHQAPTGRESTEYPGGHGNLGLAHGITGPLALLALAVRRGITVDGHIEAIDRICSWLDAWQHEDEAGTWWPRWVTHDEHRTGSTKQPNPMRLTWCYGTPAQARAQQLAAVATGDTRRRRMAENALLACAADEQLPPGPADGSLCHGWAGVLQTLRRAAADAATGHLAAHLDRLESQARRGLCVNTGLLEGSAGNTLALLPPACTAPIRWDACMLTTA